MNDQVGDYVGLVESLAHDIARSRRAQQVGAEYDDLVQEGLIAVWRTIEKGEHVSKEFVLNRMKNYMRWLGRHTPVDYDEMLPLHDETAAS